MYIISGNNKAENKDGSTGDLRENAAHGSCVMPESGRAGGSSEEVRTLRADGSASEGCQERDEHGDCAAGGSRGGFTVSEGELGGISRRTSFPDADRRYSDRDHNKNGREAVGNYIGTARFRKHTRSGGTPRGIPLKSRHDGDRRLRSVPEHRGTAAVVMIAFFVIGFVTGCAVWNTGSSKQQCAEFVDRYMSFARSSGFTGCFGAGVRQQFPVFAAIVISAFFVAGFAACPVIIFIRGMGTAMVFCSLFSRISEGMGIVSGTGAAVTDSDILSGAGMIAENAVSGSDGALSSGAAGTFGAFDMSGAVGMAAAAVYIALTTAVLVAAASDAAGVSSDIAAGGASKRCGSFLARAAVYALLLAAVSALHAGAVFLLNS